MPINTAKVDYSLSGALKISEIMSPEDLEYVKPIVNRVQDMAADPSITTQKIYLFASAIKEISQSMMIYAQGLGSPSSTVVDTEDWAYASKLLKSAKLMGKVSAPKDEQTDGEEKGNTPKTKVRPK